MKYIFRLTGQQQQRLKLHLHPGDNLEAAAIGLCGFAQTHDRTILLLHKVFLIPYEESKREIDKVSWDGRLAKPFLEEAMNHNLVIVKFHSHPKGYEKFSELDDKADYDLIASAYGWTDTPGHHCSLVMLPDGRLFGRWYNEEIKPNFFDCISVVDHHLQFFSSKSDEPFYLPEQYLRNQQALGEGTTQLLKKLRIGIVGCSGTGSPLIENLVRLGVGELVLVDPDKIEHKNLNRIINSTIKDADEGLFKTKVIEQAIIKMGFNTKVITFEKNLYDSLPALESLSVCDVIFGCMDSVDGRHLLNRLATFFSLPYFDLGIKLIANGQGNISNIFTAVHYLLPGQSLLERKVYTSEQLRANDLKRSNPDAYEVQLKANYIENADVLEPAVLPFNMRAASDAILELLDKIHHFRTIDTSAEHAKVSSSLLESIICHQTYGEEKDSSLGRYIGRGNTKIYLERPYFSPLKTVNS